MGSPESRIAQPIKALHNGETKVASNPIMGFNIAPESHPQLRSNFGKKETAVAFSGLSVFKGNLPSQDAVARSPYTSFTKAWETKTVDTDNVFDHTKGDIGQPIDEEQLSALRRPTLATPSTEAARFPLANVNVGDKGEHLALTFLLNTLQKEYPHLSFERLMRMAKKRLNKPESNAKTDAGDYYTQLDTAISEPQGSADLRERRLREKKENAARYGGLNRTELLGVMRQGDTVTPAGEKLAETLTAAALPSKKVVFKAAK